MQTSSFAVFGCFSEHPYNTGRSYNLNKQMSEQTPIQKKSRRQVLEGFVAQKPDDAFSRYSLALECMNSGDSDAADQHFRALLEANAGYIPGYQMYGQLLVRAQRIEEARKVLIAGIAAADKAGNAHARSEMETVLNDLG
jgi:predicted Zn-dependent protease